MHGAAIVGFIVLAVVGVVIVITRAVVHLRSRTVAKKGDASEKLPYGVRPCLLSAAELSFYHTLRLALPEGLQIIVKPRIADILEVGPGLTASDARKAFNRISQKHADFVLCTSTFVPELVIELDDRSHGLADRSSRDDLVDRIYQAAGLPIIHQSARHAYTVADLRTSIGTHRRAHLASA